MTTNDIAQKTSRNARTTAETEAKAEAALTAFGPNINAAAAQLEQTVCKDLTADPLQPWGAPISKVADTLLAQRGVLAGGEVSP